MTIPYSQANLYAAMADAVPQAVFEALTERSFFFNFLNKRASDKPFAQLKDVANDSITGGFTIGGALPDAGAADTRDLEWEWGNYYAATKLADRQLKEAAAGSSRMKIGNLLEFQVNDLVTQLVEKIATDCISGATESATAGTIVGLTGGAIEDDNTYAGVDRSVVSAHAPYVNDNGGTPRAISTTLIDTVLDTVEMVREGRVTVGFCDYNQWNAIAALSGVTETKNDTSGNGVSKFLGVTSIMYRGIPIVKVPGYTSGRLDFVDESMLELVYLPVSGVPDSQATILDSIDLKEPERDGDSLVWKAFTYWQLVLTNGRKHAASLQDLS